MWDHPREYPHNAPSVAWMSVLDIDLAEDDDSAAATAQEPPVAGEHLRSSRRRVEEAVAAAMAELHPISRRLTVTVEDPDNAELSRALRWVHDNPITPDEVCARLGVAVPEPDLPGWISSWPVSVRGTILHVIPATPPAELAVDLADGLQTVLADNWISDPAPACPGHPHPMRPAVHDDTPWWECPAGGLVRPWRQQPTPA